MDITKYLTPNGQKYIRGNEGCVLHPYDDGFGNWTIGWGMTYYPNGTIVKSTDSMITQAQADAYFLQEIQPYLQAVINYVKVPLNTNQYASLTDFCYNEGDGRFEESLLLQHINTNCVVESDFTAYCYASGKYDQGLFNRRKSEYELFMTPIISNQNKIMKTTWTKFYDSATKTVFTYFNNDKVLQNDGMTFDFATAEEAMEKSTIEDFIFWDNVPMGSGKLSA